MDPTDLGLYVAALTPIAGGVVWVVRELTGSWRTIAAQQHADSDRMIDALVAAAKADAELRDAINDVVAEVRAASAWSRATVYKPKSSE